MFGCERYPLSFVSIEIGEDNATETGVGDFIEGGGYPDVVVCAFDEFTSDFTSDFSLELELLLLSAEH